MHRRMPGSEASNLHIAASRFERLDARVLDIICTSDWIHLGEPPLDRAFEIREQLSFGRYVFALKLCLAAIYRSIKPRVSAEELRRHYASTEFREFYFKAGDRLGFENDRFTFAFAEHFLEHLWLPETFSLLAELRRIMAPGGVLRVSVPDADLRTYEPPEEPGFPRKSAWTHHQKHKMRWNVYSLSAVLESCGFRAEPVVYCTRDGVFHNDVKTLDLASSSPRAASYRASLDYLRRVPSLIVDGVKPLATERPEE